MTVVVLAQVAYGLTLARQLGPLSTGRALLTAALFVPESIGRRLINDYDDYRRGVDRPDNARPGSALALGLSMERVRVVGLTCFATSVVALAYLLATTSAASLLVLPFAFVILIYSGGPSPLGHRGLGELVDFLLTGCLVVGVVVWVNAQQLTLAAVLGAVAAGFLFAATMFHNDLRDVAEDLRAGKRTLAHALSERAAKAWYVVLMAGPYPCVALVAVEFGSLRYAAPLLTLPYAAYLTVGVLRSRLGGTMPSWFHLPRLLAVFFALFVLAGWI
ncbi:prenyltransferase [Streptomyces sp. DSM 44915]|uniref:Prenyltransferase n=2 Tax=Streptomyces chisholmiae TaxID=3075540 RepID=A0ABU2JUT0_9ACTN|nr:prenyltransferase [Streptomyces sp. DSM 44915]